MYVVRPCRTVPPSLPSLVRLRPEEQDDPDGDPDGGGALALHCPFDRQPTRLGPNGVWDLKKNFALIELLERVFAAHEKTHASLLAPAHLIASSAACMGRGTVKGLL